MESTQSADMLSVPESPESMSILEEVDKQVSELADKLAESGEETVEVSGTETVDSCQIFDASPVESDAVIDSIVSDDGQEGEPVAADATAGATGARAAAAPRSAAKAMVDADDRVSKKDLVALLEGFVKIIKTDDVPVATQQNQAAGTGMTTVQANQMVLSEGRGEAHIDDRTVEIDQLRGLVIEAQDTIIKLLTDRVEDRSRIATLEAQLSLLPDLQAQADRAMSVAVRTEEYRTELNKMKFELDRFRLFRVRQEAEQKKATIFNRIQKWLFSRPNAPDETLQNKN